MANKVIDVAVWQPFGNDVSVIFQRPDKMRFYKIERHHYPTLVQTLRCIPGSFRPFWSGPGFVYTPKRPTDTDS